MRAAQAAAFSALLASLLVTAGCYKPNIKPGALICGPGGACPDNFKCVMTATQALCFPNNYDAGATGGTGGSMPGTGGGTGGTSTGGVPGTGGTGPVDAACLGPVTPCTRGDAGMCDPVCNVGCGQCYQKCSVDSVGGLTCNALSGTSVGILQLCQPSQTSSADPSTQSDNCQPGSACIAHNACGARCYQFCRQNGDCQTNASCTIDAGGGNSFCDVPTVDCDPVQGAATNPATSRCPGGNTLQSCYLSSDTGKTVCDCYQAGVGKGQPCARARDCFGGLTCTDPYGNRPKACYKVCRLPSPDGGAATPANSAEQGCSASVCTPILLSNGTMTTVYGVCPE